MRKLTIQETVNGRCPFFSPLFIRGVPVQSQCEAAINTFGAVLLASSILLLFRYVGSAYAVHLRHLEKGALCCPRSRAGQRRGSGSCPRWLEESRDRAAEERTGTRAAACGDVKLGWSDRELRLLRLEHA